MKTVVVIDDDLTLLQDISAWLCQEGFQAFTATQGKQGLKLIQHQPPDLILCDVRMPIMDGVETLKVLRNQPLTAEIPFIFLTSEVDIDHFFTVLRLGVTGFLKKPVNFTELHQVLHRIDFTKPQQASFVEGALS